MGFSMKNAIREIAARMTFRVKDDRAPAVTVDATVVHYMRLPTPAEREKHRNDSSDVKRGKAKLTMSYANRNLWSKIVTKVEGYDDIEEATLGEPEKFRSYFDNEIGSIHIDTAIGILMEHISGNEDELEKNSGE